MLQCLATLSWETSPFTFSAVFVPVFVLSPCLSLKKVDSQKARNNVYLSNTEERTVL